MSILQTPVVRPPVLPFEIDLELQGYTLINYPVPASRLRPFVPDLLTLATTKLNGAPMAWLSIFIGRNVLRRIGHWPAFPLQFNQVNYRTYVEGPNGRRLFIFRSLIGPELLAHGARLMPQLPAVPQPFFFAPEIAGDRLLNLEAEVGPAGRELSLRVENMEGAPLTPGFASAEEGIDFLGNVPEALFPLPTGGLGQMFADHPPLTPEAGRIVTARFHWLAEQQLLAVDEVNFPASIFMQGRVDFPVRM